MSPSCWDSMRAVCTYISPIRPSPSLCQINNCLKMQLRLTQILSPLLIVFIGSLNVNGCRINSELLKGYARKTVERLLVPDHLGSLYWPDEPLPANPLSKAIGINVTLVETHFQVESGNQVQYEKQKNEIVSVARVKPNDNTSTDSRASLIQDIFVTCSIDRDRSYALSINLELENPFKVVDIYYESKGLLTKKEASEQNQTVQGRRIGLFRIHLPQSSLLVQLNQRIRYDECLSVNYVQLSPTVNYEIECVDCDKSEQEFLDKIFNKRMSQLDSELDAMLSEKVLFGLQVLLSQQRLDLDTYLN